MDYLSKVSLSKGKYREYMVKISVVGTISLAGLALCIYNLTISSYIFALWYFIAFILGLSYTIIRINSVFPPYIAVSESKLILSVWENGILPYKVSAKSSFFADFIPEKVKTEEIELSDIDCVFIGSKKYIKRSLSDFEYPEILRFFDNDKHYDSITKRMDFIYIMTKQKENCFMSVTHFDITALSELLSILEKQCMGVQIHTNHPKLMRIRNRIKKA